MTASIAFVNGHETASVWRQHLLFQQEQHCFYTLFYRQFSFITSLCKLAQEQEQHDWAWHKRAREEYKLHDLL
jgi:hypothetical protein